MSIGRKSDNSIQRTPAHLCLATFDQNSLGEELNRGTLVEEVGESEEARSHSSHTGSSARLHFLAGSSCRSAGGGRDVGTVKITNSKIAVPFAL